MKISSIGSYSFYQNKQKYDYLKGAQSSSPVVAPGSKSYSTYPVYFNSLAPSITFGCAGDYIAKNISGIPCPCCGKIMIPKRTFLRILTENALSGRSDKAIEAIEYFEDYMHPIEKECFKIVRNYSKNAPEKSLQQIMQDLRPESLKRLVPRQFRVLDKIDELGKKLSYKSQTSLRENTALARQIISLDTPDYLFKRKTFLNKLMAWKDELPNEEKRIGRKIYQTALNLDTSQNNVDAFILKYSGTVRKTILGQRVKIHRSSTEIGQRFVITIVGTYEHLIPKSEGGQLSNSDGVAECLKCNNARGNMPLNLWVKANKKMKENAQRYIEAVIANKHLREKFPTHPVLVARTFYKESKHKIKLLISREMQMKKAA